MEVYFAFDFGRKTSDCGVAGTDWEKIFESGYDDSDVTFGDENELYVDGRYLRFSGRGSVEPYPLESPRMLHCTDYGVCQYLEESGADPDEEHSIVVGGNIPLKTFGIEKDDFINYYPHELRTAVYKGKEWKFRYSSVYMFPQGVVAYTGAANAYKGKKVLQVLDIGSRTVIGFIADRSSGKVQFTNDFMEDGLGVISLIDSIRERLEQDRIFIPETAIVDAINGNGLDHRKSREIIRIAAEKRDQYVENIINQCHQHRFDLNTPTLLVGGGGDDLEPYIREKMHVIGSLGVMANMEGIKLSLEHIKKKAEKNG